MTRTDLPRDRARPWKALLLVNSVLASVVGWAALAVHDVRREPGVPQPSVQAELDVAEELQLEPLPPVPSLRRPVATSRPSR